MNKLFKRVTSACLALALVICVTVPVKKVDAAQVGEQRWGYELYTLAEINALCNKFEKLAGQAVSGNDLAELICDITDIPVAGTLYSLTFGMIQYDMLREYKFYKNIRDEMIKRGSKKVRIRYITEYTVHKIYWERYYVWQEVEKTVWGYK